MKKYRISQNYKIAVTEVLAIMEYLPQETVRKIPEKFKEFLKLNSISDYEPQFDFSKGLEEIELKKKTKLLLAMIYRNFICSDKERLEYDVLLGKNEDKYKVFLKENYSTKSLFDKLNNQKI